MKKKTGTSYRYTPKRGSYGYTAWKKKRRKQILKAGLTCLALLLLLSVFFGAIAYARTGTPHPTMELFDGRATFRFFDVGQGDCALVTWRGDAVLIDAGPYARGKRTAETVEMYAPVVDYFIVTHPHEDHMGGAAAVLNEVKVKNLVLPAASSDEWFYEEAMKAAAAHDVNVITVTDGAVFELENLSVTILDPLDLPTDDLNDVSLIARIEAGGVSLLAAGDAELPAEEHAMSLDGGLSLLDCDILKAGHHGSYSSTSQAFLEAVSPETVVISVGRHNAYSHPHRETMARLKEYAGKYGTKIRRTDEDGTVVLRGLRDPAA